MKFQKKYIVLSLALLQGFFSFYTLPLKNAHEKDNDYLLLSSLTSSLLIIGPTNFIYNQNCRSKILDLYL